MVRYAPCRSSNRLGLYRGVQVVPLKLCASCAREIPDSATLCETCRQWAVGVTAAPASPDASVSQEASVYQEAEEPLYSATPSSTSPAAIASTPLGAAQSTPPATATKRPSRVIVIGGVAAAGLIIVAFMARGGTGATEVTAVGAGPGGAPASAAARAATAASPSASFTQTWSGGNSAYWVGNRRKSAAFELHAESTVQVWMRAVRPTLVVRCMGQSTQVFVVTESPMKIEAQTEDHTVTYSIDGEPAVSERWPDSDEHDALFAPDGEAFAKRLMSARSFRFGFTPHNVPSVTTDFNVAGLAPLLEPVSKECGWKK